MSKLSKYWVTFTNNQGYTETMDVMAYDGYDAKVQVMRKTFGRARIIDISRA